MEQQSIISEQTIGEQTIGEKYDLFLEQNYNPNPNYVGEYNDDGEMHGIGSIKTYLFGHVHISTDNYEYEGDFVNGAITGTGIFNWGNGDAYSGDVLDGRLHGYGILYYSSGCTYEGTWRNNCKHGKGIYYYVSGNTYDGEWKNGKKQGKGVFRNKDRKIIFDGEWKNGEQTGYGIMYNPEDETKIEGYFHNGTPVNEFVYQFNQEYETDYTNHDYDKILTYMQKTKLEVADAIEYSKTCHFCGFYKTKLEQEFCSYLCTVAEPMCFRGDACKICKPVLNQDASDQDTSDEEEDDTQLLIQKQKNQKNV